MRIVPWDLGKMVWFFVKKKCDFWVFIVKK